MPSLLEPYVSHLFNQASYLTGYEELIEAARVYLESVNCRSLRGALESCGAPSGFPSILAFQEYLVFYVCGIDKDYSCITGPDTYHTRLYLKCGEVGSITWT